MNGDDENNISEEQFNRAESFLNRIMKNKDSIKPNEKFISIEQINGFFSVFKRILKKNESSIKTDKKFISVKQITECISLFNKFMKDIKPFVKTDEESSISMELMKGKIANNDLPEEWEIAMVSHFRWECLRRNPDYKKAYDEWLVKSESSFVKTFKGIAKDLERNPDCSIFDIIERSPRDIEKIYEEFGREWQCPPLDYNRTLNQNRAYFNFNACFEPGGFKRIVCRKKDKEFMAHLYGLMSIARVNWLSRDELAYPYKMDGEKIILSDFVTEFKKQMGLKLLEDDVLKNLSNAVSAMSKLKKFDSIKGDEMVGMCLNKIFYGVKTMNITINLDCPKGQIIQLLDTYIEAAQKGFGVVSKESFIEADLNGSEILDKLIKDRVLEKVSTNFVRLRRKGDALIGRPSEIQSSKFDVIWKILQQPQAIKPIERKHFKNYFNCLKIYDLKKEGIIEKSVFAKEFSNGALIFDWLKKEGYLEEDAGLEDYPKELTDNLKENLKVYLKREYQMDSSKIIKRLQMCYRKRKSFLDIGKETHVYFDGFEENEFKKPASARSLLDALSKKGIKEFDGDGEIEKLNNLLEHNALYKRFPKEAEDAGYKANLQGKDLIRSNRRILEMAFPKECPIKEEEDVNDSSLERQARRDFEDAKEFILRKGYRNVR